MRLIAGRWRGRRLPVADVAGLRPSGDRLRETLFNWLQPDIVGAHCLDLFAGTGALGFEALSRGAASVVMVETDLVARGMLADAARRLGATALVRLERGPAARVVAIESGPYDIVFVDPPFDRPELLDCLSPLSARLADDARVYVEQPASRALDLDALGYELLRERRFGEVSARLFRPLGSALRVSSN